MHELSIAEEIVRQVVECASGHESAAVVSVVVETGVMRLVEHEALRTAFTIAATGTAAEGAALVVTDVAARSRCRACRHEYSISEITDFTCPECGAADADIVSGNDIVLREFEITVGEEG